MVRDDQHGQVLLEAGVTRVLNPFNDAADFAAKRFVEELAAAPAPECADDPAATPRAS